jgi:nucleoside-diphosphate-sugar epimerase
VPTDLEPLADWVTADLSEPLRASSLPSEVDAIVHMAQSTRYTELPAGTADVVAVNLRSTEGLLDYARDANAERFVYFSSGGVYARQVGAIREDSEIDPKDVYFTSKRDAELLVGAAEPDPLPIVLRPFFIYGPGQERMLVARLVSKVVHGEQLVVAGKPGLRTNPIYVGDAVAALDAALRTQEGGDFNLAGEETVSITELIALIGEIAGQEPRIRYSDSDDDGDLIGDNEKMKSVLGVSPRTSLRKGLREMIGDSRRDADRGGLRSDSEDD